MVAVSALGAAVWAVWAAGPIVATLIAVALVLAPAERPTWTVWMAAVLALLALPHLVASLTRPALWARPRREQLVLLVVAPLFVAAGALVAAQLVGVWLVVTTFLWIHWLHYAGASDRIQQRLAVGGGARDGLGRAALYAVPAAALLYRAVEPERDFFGLVVAPLRVPAELAVGALALSALLVVGWALRTGIALRRNPEDLKRAIFVAGQLAVFAVGYLAPDRLDVGWLCVTGGHAAQHWIWVWLEAGRSDAAQARGAAGLLLRIRQPLGGVAFPVLQLAAALLLVLAVWAVWAAWASGGRPAEVTAPLLVTYMLLDFHHYALDAATWSATSPTR